MTIIGVTGGIGCGKSTVAAMMAARGFRRIDSDQLIRDEVLTLPEVRAQLADRFGGTVLGPDGFVNRRRLAEVAFADDTALAFLEEVTHPQLFECWRRLLAEKPAGGWVVEVPLLFEKKLENWFDFTVCVACAPAQQLARLEQRGLPHALAEQRISKQLPLARKIELSDFVLWNEGTAQFLQAQVDQLVQALPVGR
jgi:dephospho-CoA kinase